MERVLPRPEIKKRLAAIAVGLSSDCDRPERPVQEMLRAHLRNARTLPFVAFVTHDGKWVDGYSGFKQPDAFLTVLKKVEKTPHLQASKAVRKKLAALVSTSKKAAERNEWKRVLKAVRTGAKTTGRCPERRELAALETQARTWAESQLAGALKTARADDLDAAKDALAAVRKQFTGEPESVDAVTGLKALKEFARLRDAEAGSDAYAKAAARYRKSRWKALFARDAE